MTDKKLLSLEDQGLVRKYMLKLVAIPGGILVLVSFFLGYFINDLATGSAYQDAYKEAFSDVVKTVSNTSRDVSTALVEAETARKSAVGMQEELDTMFEKVQTSDLFTSTQRQIDEISTNLLERQDFIDRVNSLQDFKDFNRNSRPQRVRVHGGGRWGSWHKASYCPENYYVCGLSQKVESSQGRGDDTALNEVALECCPLFDE